MHTTRHGVMGISHPYGGASAGGAGPLPTRTPAASVAVPRLSRSRGRWARRSLCQKHTSADVRRAHSGALTVPGAAADGGGGGCSEINTRPHRFPCSGELDRKKYDGQHMQRDRTLTTHIVIGSYGMHAIGVLGKDGTFFVQQRCCRREI